MKRKGCGMKKEFARDLLRAIAVVVGIFIIAAFWIGGVSLFFVAGLYSWSAFVFFAPWGVGTLIVIGSAIWGSD